MGITTEELEKVGNILNGFKRYNAKSVIYNGQWYPLTIWMRLKFFFKRVKIIDIKNILRK